MPAAGPAHDLRPRHPARLDTTIRSVQAACLQPRIDCWPPAGLTVSATRHPARLDTTIRSVSGSLFSAPRIECRPRERPTVSATRHPARLDTTIRSLSGSMSSAANRMPAAGRAHGVGNPAPRPIGHNYPKRFRQLVFQPRIECRPPAGLTVSATRHPARLDTTIRSLSGSMSSAANRMPAAGPAHGVGNPAPRPIGHNNSKRFRQLVFSRE